MDMFITHVVTYTDLCVDFRRPPESSECLMQRQMSLKHHYLDDGMKGAFEMQIRGMTCILGAGINSILAASVVQALRVCLCVSRVCDVNSCVGVSVRSGVI